jgi:hypothetical protein
MESKHPGKPLGCDYGSDRNTCAFDANDKCVYSAKRLNGPKKITISYVPDEVTGETDTIPEDLEVAKGKCKDEEITKYRLVLYQGGLALAAVKGDSKPDKPCDEETFPDGFTVWHMSASGVFTEDSNSCLRIARDTMLGVSTEPGECTSCNQCDAFKDECDAALDLANITASDDGGWSFYQDGVAGGPHFCMPRVGAANRKKNKKQLIPDKRFKAAAVGSCSGGWHMDAFENHGQAESTFSFDAMRSVKPPKTGPKTCADCLGAKKTFLRCLSEDICIPAPRESACENVEGSGEWCEEEPATRICAPGIDDWVKKAPRKECKIGCEKDVCITKKTDKNEPAEPCIAQNDKKETTSHGCWYGSDANTCAVDMVEGSPTHGQCVYSYIPEEETIV